LTVIEEEQEEAPSLDSYIIHWQQLKRKHKVNDLLADEMTIREYD
jgi:hypothetical protein